MAAAELDRFYASLDTHDMAQRRFVSICGLKVDEQPAALVALGNDLGFQFDADDVERHFEALGLQDELTDEELDLVSGGATASTTTKPICTGGTTCRTCCPAGVAKCTSCTCPKLCV